MARKHKIQKALTHLVQAIIRFAQKLTSRNTYRFLRTAFITSRRRLQAGFVLPTTMLLIIVMMLVVSTLIFRSYQRSTEVIGEFQRQRVQNAAAPAIERAKAKIEYLFDRDLPSTAVPSEQTIEELLAQGTAPYTLPEEKQFTIDHDGDGTVVGWTFDTDTDGDGTDDAITAYTILVRSGRDMGGQIQTVDPKKVDLDRANFKLLSDNERPEYMVVRNGPLSGDSNTDPACEPRTVVSGNSQASNLGWFDTGSSALIKKNLQVFAVTIPKSLSEGESSVNSAISTLMYQQDRTYERANKWGAWFRTDIELYTGPTFNWNGAIHTEGSLFVMAYEGLQNYLISAPDSCFFNPKLNSEVSAAKQVVYAVPAAPSTESAFKGKVKFDIHENPNNPVIPVIFDATQDSVTSTANSIDLTLDPQKLLAFNISEYRKPGTLSVDTNWGSLDINGRIVTKNTCPPYIDDSYRADDLYGPKPGYEPSEKDPEDPTRCLPPEGVTNPDIGAQLTDTKLIRNEPPALQPGEYGLDGYWERRARGEGLRIIGGQRLELGNAFGWGKDGEDPLNPSEANPAYTPMSGRNNELKQRRTLRDNLAAVQATAVYHHSDASKGYHPIAYVATTVHPGTSATLTQSATFERLTTPFKTVPGSTFAPEFGNDQNEILIDFFNGKGTNGWEFEPLTQNDFATQIENTKPLGKALRNLASFAGDPDGAFPVQTAGHPDPYLTMWGNFSQLRRALAANPTLPTSGSVGNVSLADATTIHTAAGMLGMLAYNISYLQSYDYTNATNKTKLEDLDRELKNLSTRLGDNNNANGEIRLNTTTNPNTIEFYNGSGTTPIATVPANTVLPPHFYISLLPEDDQTLARLLHTKEQVKRDRTNGFLPTPATADVTKYEVKHRPPDNAFTFGGSTYQNGDTIDIGCDFSDSAQGNNFFGFGEPSNETTADKKKEAEERFIRLARTFCSPEPKFPSLYYIFPTANHDHNGGDTQPDTEGYVKEVTVNGSVTYESLADADIANMALKPRSIDFKDWVLPQQTTTITGTHPNNSARELVLAGKTLHQVAIKDSALYDGREAMNVRVLNLDLEMLKDNAIGSDTWLPASGIVYAFREDAVREDAIYNAGNPIVNNIMTKAVDYYPDPDRRPYGFRFKNGRYINRGDTNPRGMTYVSDNPVYVQGHFNLHNTKNTATANEIQEFTNNPTNNFYGRTGLNEDFAKPGKDNWRPTEIIADAITILSDNFCDGSIEDGIIYPGNDNPPELNGAGRATKYGCNNASSFTSYLSQNRPWTALPTTVPTTWLRENPFYAQSPIVINKNGVHQITDGTTPTNYSGAYDTFAARLSRVKSKQASPPLINPAPTTVNMVLVSGVTPTQTNQLNGGLHNFPRLLENWQDKILLTIQGSLIQLNFSNYATGPFDQDAWEPGSTPTTRNMYPYYQPPLRNWGYDVGLQYLPAGPIAERMVQLADPRDEFYRELRADDAYICKLRNALKFNCP